MFRHLVFLCVALMAPGALAESSTSAKSCAEALSTARSTPASPLDYQVSDLEGLFFELVEKVQSIGTVEPARLEYFVKDVLNMKAQILNKTNIVLPLILASDFEAQKQARVLVSIYQIIDTLGLPPAIFGLKLNDKSEVVVPDIERGAQPEMPVVPKRSVGFLPHEGEDARDIPAGHRRSIGFAPFRIEANPPPLRLTGYIARERHPQWDDVLLILDLEKKKSYAVYIQIMNSMVAELSGHQYQLGFDQDVAEWVLRRINLNNPTGQIGFR